MKKIWKNYGLSITLFVLFFVSWVGQGIFQWYEFVSEEKTHGQEVEILEFIYAFGKSTFENWQSEFLQLFTFVVLATFLIHKNSPQSKDGDDEMMERIKRIESAVVRKKK